MHGALHAHQGLSNMRHCTVDRDERDGEKSRLQIPMLITGLIPIMMRLFHGKNPPSHSSGLMAPMVGKPGQYLVLADTHGERSHHSNP
jgi:hypothetical protein